MLARVQKQQPEWSGQAWWGNKFQQIDNNTFKGKYVVMFFWPLDFTFVCPTEICQFNDKAKEFEAIGVQLVGVSIDSHFTHMEYTKKDRKKGGLGPMQIPMLSDVTHKIARDFGCLVEEGPDAGVALRATYIIDGNGKLRHMSMNDLPVGRNVDETLRLVRAFQYTDEHGEVCPASWTPGKATMTPGDEGKLQQFWENEHGK